MYGSAQFYDGRKLLQTLSRGEALNTTDRLVFLNEYGTKIVRVRISSGDIGWIRLDRTDFREEHV
jgi:hypothetical protein